MESLPQLAIIIIIKLSTKKFKLDLPALNSKAVLLLLIGLIGILPLMLTLVQKGFYMVPALPFIAIGLAIFIANDVYFLVHEKLLQSKLFPYFKFTFIILACISITLPITKIGKCSRDTEKLEDIRLLGSTLPNHSVINCSEDLLEDWSLQTYLSRYFYMSLDTRSPHTYYLCEKGVFESKKEEYSKGFIVIAPPLKAYYLLKRK
jgi:hypothetical protein